MTAQTAQKTLLEGVFAVAKPASVSSPRVLIDLQSIFLRSETFAPLLAETRRKRAEQAAHQPPGQKRKNEEGEGRYFRMGHGGTLDPLAAGVLVVGIGRGTKRLQDYLACSKTYETVVLFGKSTDSYDLDGSVVEEKESAHITEELVRNKLAVFQGQMQQVPPLYSALKINGVKACEYARQGNELPRDLPSREVEIDECSLLEWKDAGLHDFRWPGEFTAAQGPAARVKLSVSSGFYVRSFAYDLGVLCDSLGTMAHLTRTQQANFVTTASKNEVSALTAVTYEQLHAGEHVWGPIVQKQLLTWMEANPVKDMKAHIDGRSAEHRTTMQAERQARPRQRHLGERQADTRQGRIAQSGGKHKGDNYVYFPKKSKAVPEAAGASEATSG